jgi:integrase
VSRSLATDFQSLCDRADVKYGREVEGGITLHTLRHTCATNLVRAGVRESIIAAILGDTVQTVVDTYVNLTEDDLAAGVSRGPSFDLAA